MDTGFSASDAGKLVPSGEPATQVKFADTDSTYILRTSAWESILAAHVAGGNLEREVQNQALENPVLEGSRLPAPGELNSTRTALVPPGNVNESVSNPGSVSTAPSTTVADATTPAAQGESARTAGSQRSSSTKQE